MPCKILVAVPNYAGAIPHEVYMNHIECAMRWMSLPDTQIIWASIERRELGLARHLYCVEAIRRNLDYIFWLDDDGLIHPDFLPQLLAVEVDWVCVPFAMRLHNTLEVDGQTRVMWPDMRLRLGVRMFEPAEEPGEYHRTLRWDELDQGVIECRSSGLHCTLMKVDMLRKTYTDKVSLQEEWEKGVPRLRENGTPMIDAETNQPIIDKMAYVLMPNTGGEDVLLCDRLRQRGYRFYCHTDLFSGHLMNRFQITRKVEERHAVAQ